MHYFEGAKGNTYFMWQEDPNNPSHLSNRQNVITVIQNALLKYFSRAHKRIVRTMTENVMFDQISPAQFHLIYREISGDYSALDTKQQAEYNLKMQTIMGNLDSSLCRHLRIYNARKSKYDKFWEIAAAKIEEMTAVDDRRHATASIETGDVVVNKTLAISTPDLHKKCCQEAEKAGLTAEETPSLSCFKLQFWPKDATTYSVLNYMGRFSIKYMIQQRMARKAHDVHYAEAVYKYAMEYAGSIRDLVSFICTDDKHKILVGECGFPVATLPRGRWVLVGKNDVFQVADHDFSNLSLIPTVILTNHISESAEDSWYRGEPNVLLKITAISPSRALMNAREVADVLIVKHGSIEQIPPALIMYTDILTEVQNIAQHFSASRLY